MESFAVVLAQHFLQHYPQVRKGDGRDLERGWDRLEIAGKPHPHSFQGGPKRAKMFTRVVCSRAFADEVQSGIRDLVILKSTGSGFENYPKDEFTTLPETADRILATSFSATWRFEKLPGELSRSE